MDANQDGLLSRAELGETPEPTGCPASKAASRYWGDLFLMGLAMLMLLGNRLPKFS
jgi:hypothetical protein